MIVKAVIRLLSAVTPVAAGQGRCLGTTKGRSHEEARRAKAPVGGWACHAVTTVDAHGAYVNGCRNASAALAAATANTSWLVARMSPRTIRVFPVLRSHSSEIV